MATFLSFNIKLFETIIGISSLAITLGGLTFAGGSIQQRYMKNDKYTKSVFKSSLEFIVSGFLILSSLLLVEYSGFLQTSIPDYQLNLYYRTVVILAYSSMVVGPFFLSLGFRRLLTTIKKYYMEL